MPMWPWSKKGGERRRGKRHEALAQASYRVIDAVTRRHLTTERSAQVIDISEDGCGLLIPEPTAGDFSLKTCLQYPQDYLLELKLKPSSGGTWRLHGAVRWLVADKAPSGNGIRLGLRFENPVALPGQWQRLLLATPAPTVQGGAAVADASGN
jgi:hypothetical protein